MIWYALIAAGAFLVGYGVKTWQDMASEWRCAFVHKYDVTAGWHWARCELRLGHFGPHRVRYPGFAPDHYANLEAKKE